jgi:hypothetical protein
MAQIVEWNPMIINNKDDIIDPIGYVDELVRDYGDLMIKNTFDEDNFAGTSYHMLSADVPF